MATEKVGTYEPPWCERDLTVAQLYAKLQEVRRWVCFYQDNVSVDHTHCGNTMAECPRELPEMALLRAVAVSTQYRAILGIRKLRRYWDSERRQSLDWLGESGDDERCAMLGFAKWILESAFSPLSELQAKQRSERPNLRDFQEKLGSLMNELNEHFGQAPEI